MTSGRMMGYIECDKVVENSLIGAQTKGQFHLLYGAEETQALFTSLATQVIYGGCDADTAEFYSKASGTATTDANQDDLNSHLRQRPLLTVDEIVTPQVSNCTIFARYAEAGFATQMVLNARLTRFYEREDWKRYWLIQKVLRAPAGTRPGTQAPAAGRGHKSNR